MAESSAAPFAPKSLCATCYRERHILNPAYAAKVCPDVRCECLCRCTHPAIHQITRSDGVVTCLRCEQTVKHPAPAPQKKIAEKSVGSSLQKLCCYCKPLIDTDTPKFPTPGHPCEYGECPCKHQSHTPVLISGDAIKSPAWRELMTVDPDAREIEKWFTIPVSSPDTEIARKLADHFKTLAWEVLHAIPRSADRTAAFRKLRESFWTALAALTP